MESPVITVFLEISGYPLLDTLYLLTLRNGPVSRLIASLLAVVVLFGFQGPVRAQSEACPCHDVAFVCDGAGNYQITSKQLRGVVAATHAPLSIETFVWSHGYKKILPDQTDLQHARQKGQLLAEEVLHFHCQHPDVRIHLVGHSAGSMVVLSATEHLPPETLDTI